MDCKKPKEALGAAEGKKYLDKTDAYAALIAGCNDCSEEQARRRLDWYMATSKAEDRESLQKAIDHFGEIKFFRLFPEHLQREAWKKMGEELAKEHRKRRRAPKDKFVGPGSAMLRIACLLFSKRKVVRVFLPLISDYQREYAQARREGLFKATVTKIEWWYRFGQTCGLDVVLKLAGGIAKFGL